MSPSAPLRTAAEFGAGGVDESRAWRHKAEPRQALPGLTGFVCVSTGLGAVSGWSLARSPSHSSPRQSRRVRQHAVS